MRIRKEGNEMPLANGEVVVAEKERQVVVSSKALQLAKGWVRNMVGESDSDSEADDSKIAELEARPPRLGLGAKYLPHFKVAATMSPVEKKLRAMTGATKQQRKFGDHIGNHKSAVSTSAKELKSDAESSDEEEVKGSSRMQQGRQQRRIGSADLFWKNSGPKGRGSKRKR